MKRKELKSVRKSKGQRKGWSTLKEDNPNWVQRLNVVVEVKAHVSSANSSRKVEEKLQSQYFLIP
ncbi:hypothetical protein [Algoriphagus marinus]|uniref:hypothetical protein n=1 Tax=Algoriphagus marinus TaxID=1925762 RepID=UPI00094BB390|nr:hypothetical protein [Algoriphagus marinus]